MNAKIIVSIRSSSYELLFITNADGMFIISVMPLEPPENSRPLESYKLRMSMEPTGPGDQRSRKPAGVTNR
jgi:hypothetical protein